MGLSNHSKKGLKITEECWKAVVIGRLGVAGSIGKYRRAWEPEGGNHKGYWISGEAGNYRGSRI